MDKWIIIVITSCSLIISILSIMMSRKTKKNYERYVEKLGNGDNIAETLKSYINQVDKLNRRDDEIIKYCEYIDLQQKLCIKKVGLVRYDINYDLKNKLSFALALLDDEDNGVVINSIYGLDNSNIYAKPVMRGSSSYKLSSEEQDAIKKAINLNNKD